MAENTKIEWTDHTFNPWEGCQKVGPGCDNCYAETRNARFAGGEAINWGPGAPRRRTSAANWNKPKAWNAAHAEFFAQHGRRQRVFCASLADVFDNAVPDEWRMDLFKLIAATPNLDWLLLTKRIGNVRQYTQRDGMAFDLIGDGRVWLGATITNQEEADRDIPKLLAVPARVRFLSMEPLLGPVRLPRFCACGCKKLLAQAVDEATGGPSALNSDQAAAAIESTLGVDWVIVGGESGPGARPMHPDWARSLRDQCAAAGVPFLFKQWGEHDLSYDRDRDDPDYCRCVSVEKQPGRWINLAGGHGFNGERVHYAHRVGKKTAGRLLDGRTHDGFPGQSAAAHKGSDMPTALQRKTAQVLAQVPISERGICGYTKDGHHFQVEREEDSDRFYIIVKAPCGSTCYDGWWPNTDDEAQYRTLESAVSEAINGAGLLPQAQKGQA